jgi:NAD(P)-dependent dehydrogenase (short-subunit alcohol dehydrogenase family)
MEWRDQVAVVTGGARGLGRATAWLLAQRGGAVCVNYAAHADAAEKLIAEIAAAGGGRSRWRRTSRRSPQSRRWSAAPKQSWVR